MAITAFRTTSRAADIREEQFLRIVDEHSQLISKICYMYAEDTDHFNDLYQETLANLWQGMDSFRGDSRISTWIYRMTINSCVTFYRRHRRHSADTVPLDSLMGVAGDDGVRLNNLKEMYRLISTLDRVEKAIILMWLDERTYDEIAEVTGMARNTVATRLRRIKQKLARRANE